MKSIRGGMGLGDALYVQAVARHLVMRGERLRVHTAWPDVFCPLGDGVQIAPFTRQGINILAHYSLRKKESTNQFEDVCIAARVENCELKLDWPTPTSGLAVDLQRDGRQILLVQLPRTPMGRTDGFGKELLPDCRVIQRIINRYRDHALIVQIGAGEPLFKFDGIEIDLANKTTVSQMFDVAAVADGFLGYVSFIVPLAESFGKPLLCVWSSRGLKSGTPYIRQITPQKILSKPSSRFVVDNWASEAIAEVTDEFLRERAAA